MLFRSTKRLNNAEIMAHALKGTIGDRATYDMLTIVQLNDELPQWESIIADPDKTKVPKSPSAVCMLVYSAIQRCLFDDGFRKQCQIAPNPYWMGDAGPKIAKVLASVPLDQKLIRKRMTLRGEMRDGWYR